MQGTIRRSLIAERAKFGRQNEWPLTVRVLLEDDIFLIQGGWPSVTLQ
jgi:hypothetical protein